MIHGAFSAVMKAVVATFAVVFVSVFSLGTVRVFALLPVIQMRRRAG